MFNDRLSFISKRLTSCMCFELSSAKFFSSNSSANRLKSKPFLSTISSRAINFVNSFNSSPAGGPPTFPRPPPPLTYKLFNSNILELLHFKVVKKMPEFEIFSCHEARHDTCIDARHDACHDVEHVRTLKSEFRSKKSRNFFLTRYRQNSHTPFKVQ